MLRQIVGCNAQDGKLELTDSLLQIRLRRFARTAIEEEHARNLTANCSSEDNYSEEKSMGEESMGKEECATLKLELTNSIARAVIEDEHAGKLTALFPSRDDHSKEVNRGERVDGREITKSISQEECTVHKRRVHEVPNS